MAKWVYMFSEGDMTMRNLLGGKGANLAEMTSIGLPVPQGFTITTEACTQYYEDGRKINDEIMAQTMEGVKKMEELNGKKFGDLKNPLLVSVRSGARASMPGMMDTILNLGLNDEVVAAMIAGNPDPKFERFVYDSYRRFIQMFSDVVMELPKSTFEQFIDQVKDKKGVKMDNELDADDMSELIVLFKDHYKKSLGEDFPQDPKKQLMEAVRAVFRSWDNHLPPHERHPAQLGHCCKRTVHGIRQYGRDLGHRRSLHPQPGHRRKEAVRRVPDECTGRGRCSRHPHAAADLRAGRYHAGGLSAVC